MVILRVIMKLSLLRLKTRDNAVMMFLNKMILLFKKLALICFLFKNKNKTNKLKMIIKLELILS